jgi:cytochrome c
MIRRQIVIASAAGLALVGALLTAQAAGAQDALKGCNACHSDTAPPAIKGPSLKGVFGRSVAVAPGYAYSDALKGKASQKWTQANLDAYLADPNVWAPGTKMKGKAADPTQRAAVIEALKALK